MLVDMPIPIEDFAKGTEALIDFYRKLGWNPNKQFIDPAKIKLNAKDANECMERFMSCGETKSERAEYGLVWMNQGPGCSLDVPQGKVMLEKDWVVEE